MNYHWCFGIPLGEKNVEPQDDAAKAEEVKANCASDSTYHDPLHYPKETISAPTKMDSSDYLLFVEETLAGMTELIRKKNSDYTSGGGPFANFEASADFGVDPLVGLCLRMQDKWKRVQSYVKTGELLVDNEGIEDAFKDLIGYSCAALGMLKDRQGDK